MKEISEFRLGISGLGIILYSLKSVRNIPAGEDYLSENYSDTNQILNHFAEGSIGALSTGTSGTFLLRIFEGVDPSRNNFRGIIPLKVTENLVFFHDLYSMISWDPSWLPESCIEIENGLYALHVYSEKSEIIGEDQLVEVCFEKVEQLPLVASIPETY